MERFVLSKGAGGSAPKAAARALNRPMAISNRMPWRCRCALIIKRRYNKARIIGHKAAGAKAHGVGCRSARTGHLSSVEPTQTSCLATLRTSLAITIRHPLFRRLPISGSFHAGQSHASFPPNDENHASRLIVDRERITRLLPPLKSEDDNESRPRVESRKRVVEMRKNVFDRTNASFVESRGFSIEIPNPRHDNGG